MVELDVLSSPGASVASKRDIISDTQVGRCMIRRAAAGFAAAGFAERVGSLLAAAASPGRGMTAFPMFTENERE